MRHRSWSRLVSLGTARSFVFHRRSFLLNSKKREEEGQLMRGRLWSFKAKFVFEKHVSPSSTVTPIDLLLQLLLLFSKTRAAEERSISCKERMKKGVEERTHDRRRRGRVLRKLQIAKRKERKKEKSRQKSLLNCLFDKLCAHLCLLRLVFKPNVKK